MTTCYCCGTDDFRDGEYADTSYPDLAGQRFCLTCAVKYESQGASTFRAIPTPEQIAVAAAYDAAGIGTN